MTIKMPIKMPIKMLTMHLIPLLCALSAAVALPRHQASTCCFTLQDASSGKILEQEAQTGFLFLSSPQPDGRYCLGRTDQNKVLRDAMNNACIINSARLFQCLDPTPGFSRWTVQQSGGRSLLAVDGSTAFRACPSGAGSEMVWGPRGSGGSGCRDMRIAASRLEGACRGIGG